MTESKAAKECFFDSLELSSFRGLNLLKILGVAELNLQPLPTLQIREVTVGREVVLKVWDLRGQSFLE
jgi:hypothetical protein